jgi:phasin family protein
MAPPKKTTETPKKIEAPVLPPDTAAGITSPISVPTLVVAPTPVEPDAAFNDGAVEADSVAKAGLSTVANNIHKTQTEIKTTMDKAMKTAEEFVSFGHGNIEAIMKSGQIWMTGLQDLSKSFAATAQAQMEETVSTMKTFAGLRSIKEAVDLQTSFARTSFEKALSETGKITEHSMKLAEQAMAPITARVTFAVEKFGKAV